MDYAKLATVYQDLEKTTKKLEKRDIVADFFKNCPPEQLPIVALLVQGRIFPAWSEVELGVAANIMIKTLSKTAGLPDDEVKKEIRKFGDIGEGAEAVMEKKKQATLASQKLTINKVYENLIKIPEQSGSGAIALKVALLSELLSSARPVEAKYIVRTVMQEMRVGVGEGIVRNAIAKAFNVEEDLVEKANNVTNDFGEVAKVAKKSGKTGLEKLKMELGHPLKPMLAQKAKGIKEAIEYMGGTAAFEIKFDGMRMQIHKNGKEITVFTRRLDNVTKQFPEIAEYARKCITTDKCIVEGEAVGTDPKTKRPLPFQKLSRRIKRKYDIEELQKEIPVDVYLFDIMMLEGKSMVETPFDERRKKLESIVKGVEGKFQVAGQIVTGDEKKAEALYEKALKMGHEGVMAKNLKSIYTPGSRVKHMEKIKPEMETLDLAIIGALWGEGRRKKWMGSFILGANDTDRGEFVQVGKVATGLSDADLEELTNLLKPNITEENINTVEITPKIIVEVGYEEIQRSPTYESGFALRFPRVKTIRNDKGPSDTDTIDKVERLY
ncbi:MAG: ATP-dependent DNA ligase, partial [Candidatus Undinarchaeales archaeon]|nr:ATP-dependent DNA ligase [Candidatus Undinarchaeales archaeon]